MKTKKIKIKFKPLYVSMGIVVVGSISPSQSYSADTGEYDADYTLTPLVLQPMCGVVDQDEVITDGHVNPSLANMRWTEIIDGNSKVIESSNAHYEIANTGADKGRIKVKKNASILHPITLLFYAEYVDVRTNQVIIYKDSQLIDCINATSVPPVLMLDIPSSCIWNPLTMKEADYKPIQKICAKLMLAGKELTDKSRRQFFWYRKASNDTLHIIGTDKLDLDFVSKNDNELVINRELMGEIGTYVCKAEYAPIGKALTGIPSTGLEASFVIRRKIPHFEFDWTGTTDQISPGQKNLPLCAVVTMGGGVVPNPGRELFAQWYTAPDGGTKIQRGHGMTAELPTSDMNNKTGMQIGLEIKDKGAWEVLTDHNGEPLTDNKGELLIGR